MIGKYTPPARAVVDGIAGAKSASEIDNPYAKPSVLLPIVLTKKVATRSPNPVCTNPLAKKNALRLETGLVSPGTRVLVCDSCQFW
jgi:hypothetical protein